METNYNTNTRLSIKEYYNSDLCTEQEKKQYKMTSLFATIITLFVAIGGLISSIYYIYAIKQFADAFNTSNIGMSAYISVYSLILFILPTVILYLVFRKNSKQGVYLALLIYSILPECLVAASVFGAMTQSIITCILVVAFIVVSIIFIVKRSKLNKNYLSYVNNVNTDTLG